MNLRDYLLAIAASYDRTAGLQTDAQRLLREAPAHLATLAPAGYVVRGSGGKGTATFTPWIGLFDPDETDSPERGLYLCFLFSSDLRAVTLTLMHGITDLDRTLGRRAARERLAKDAATIRAALPDEVVATLSDRPRLGSGGYRQLAYQAGCVVTRVYEVDDLPELAALEGDVGRFVEIYGRAVAIHRELLQSSPGAMASASFPQQAPGDDPLRHFKPKDDADYLATMTGRVLVKTRRHERLVAQYGTWLATRGFAVSTDVHPRDLVAKRDGREWLIEAKVLYLGNATEAVRAALGQLYAYRHFLYPGSAPPTIVALFAEPVGGGFVDFLETVGVASVWHEAGRWLGSDRAVTDEIAVTGAQQAAAAP